MSLLTDTPSETQKMNDLMDQLVDGDVNENVPVINNNFDTYSSMVNKQSSSTESKEEDFEHDLNNANKDQNSQQNNAVDDDDDDDDEPKQNLGNVYLKDETNAINTEMISRHHRFQKLLAKRVGRVRRLNTIVTKTIQEASSAGLLSAEDIESGLKSVSLADQFDVDDEEEEALFDKEKKERGIREREKQAKESSLADKQKQIVQVEVSDTQLEEHAYNEAQETNSKNEFDDDEDDEEDEVIVKPKNNNTSFFYEEDDSDAEELEKTRELASKKKEQRLLDDLDQEEKLLDELEAMLNKESGTKNKNQKELLEIAAKTQALSLKYNIEPIVYTKIEIKKEDFLNDFNYVEDHSKQKNNSSPVSNQSQFDEEQNIVETDISEIEMTSKAQSSPNPLTKYANSLKNNLQFEDNFQKGDHKHMMIDLSGSDSESDDDISVIPKSKVFELKVKLAKKKAPQLKLLKLESQRKNLSKYQLASMMMKKHCETIKNMELDDAVEEIKAEKGNIGDSDISVEQLFENAMAFELKKAETLKDREASEEIELNDSDYDGSNSENSADESGYEEEEEENEIKHSQNEKPELNHDSKTESIQTQIKHNGTILMGEASDDEDVKPKKLRNKMVVDDDDNEYEIDEIQKPFSINVGSSSTQFGAPGDLQDTEAVENPDASDAEFDIPGTDNDDPDVGIRGGNLTQKIKGMFNAADTNFDLILESTAPRATQGDDVFAQLRANGSVIESEPFEENLSEAADKSETFVAGFDINEDVGTEVTVNNRVSSQDLNHFLPLETQVDEDDIDISTKHQKRLIRKVDVSEASGSSEESDIDEEEKEKMIIEANRKMFKLERIKEIQKRKKELDIRKKGLGDVFDQEAEESDDEWAGYGGRDADDGDMPDSEDEKMIDDITKVNSKDNEALMKYVHDESLIRDQELVEKIQKDIEMGKLGRRNGNFLDLDDDYEGESERLNYLRQRREKQKRKLLENDTVTSLSKNKKAKAFLESITEETNTSEFRELIGSKFVESGDVAEAKSTVTEAYVKRQLSALLDSDDEADIHKEIKKVKVGDITLNGDGENDSSDEEDDEVHLARLKLKSSFSSAVTFNSEESNGRSRLNRLRLGGFRRVSSHAVTSYRSLQEETKVQISDGKPVTARAQTMTYQTKRSISQPKPPRQSMFKKLYPTNVKLK